MSTKTKFAALAIAALTLTAGLTASNPPAHAGKGFGIGLGVGLATGALVGAAMASGPAYGVGYYGYSRCRWVRQYDAYGFYIGRERVCAY
jgi:hypothetical protein